MLIIRKFNLAFKSIPITMPGFNYFRLMKQSKYFGLLQKPNIYDKKVHDIKNWYMSEKLDGIRAYWTGKELLSKNGNKITYADL